MYTRGDARIGILPTDQSVYIMVSGKHDFQQTLEHMVPSIDAATKRHIKKQLNMNISNDQPRLSVTCRYNGEHQPHQVDKQYSSIWEGDGVELGLIPCLQTYTYADVMKLVVDDLVSDKTVMFGKQYTNNGRKSCSYSTSDAMNVYSYGGKTVPVKPMSNALAMLLHTIQDVAGFEFNWMHVTYYPCGDTKLGWHSDNQKGVALCSTIAGYTLYADPNELRPVEFRPLKRKKK
jgi:hypothetical protein